MRGFGTTLLELRAETAQPYGPHHSRPQRCRRPPEALETAAAWRRSVCVPISALRMVHVEERPLAGLPRWRLPGMACPGFFVIGSRRHEGLREFAAVRAGRPAVVLDAEGAELGQGGRERPERRRHRRRAGFAPARTGSRPGPPGHRLAPPARGWARRAPERGYWRAPEGAAGGRMRALAGGPPREVPRGPKGRPRGAGAGVVRPGGAHHRVPVAPGTLDRVHGGVGLPEGLTRAHRGQQLEGQPHPPTW